eukprot:2184703-Rhodomonas_salina.1
MLDVAQRIAHEEGSHVTPPSLLSPLSSLLAPHSSLLAPRASPPFLSPPPPPPPPLLFSSFCLLLLPLLSFSGPLPRR